MTPPRNQIPDQLLALDHWIAWRAEVPEGSSRSTKVPYNLRTGRKASSTNPEDWTSFPAEDIPAHYSGLGFVFTKEIKLTGIDLDNCLTDDGSTKPWALPILRAFAGTYAEFSPSSTGVKIWAGGNIPGSGAKIFVDSKGDRCAEDNPDRSGAVEMYDTGRYFAVTGWVQSTVDLIDCQDAIDDLYSRVRPAQSHAPQPAEGGIIQEGGRHNYLLAIAGRLRNEGLDPTALLIYLRQLNAATCNPPKPERELQGIVDYLASKPPKYRLVPEDFHSPNTPQGAEPSQFADVDAALLKLVEVTIESKDAALCYSDELFNLAAQSGGSTALIARTMLKKAFGADMVLTGVPGAWNERLRDEKSKQRRLYAVPASERSSEGPSQMPEIIVSSRQLREITQDATAALERANDPPSLFIRSGEMVHVIRDESERPAVLNATESHIRGLMSRSANWMKYTQTGELKGTFPPIDVVKDMSALDPGVLPFPALSSVTEVPTLRSDGTILDTPGYDVASTVYYAPAENLKSYPLPENPTQADVYAARLLIEEAIGEFPYADHASKANVYGLLLTPVLRPAIVGCTPLAVVDAPQAGTGKSLLIDVLAIITTGRPSAMVPYPYKEEEMQKQIGASLAGGRQLICFDNLEGELRSPALALALTAKEFETRILGFSRNMTVPNVATWIVTGNNIRPAGDMPRRCYQIRLNAKQAKPYSGREFKHPNLLRWVSAHRSELLHALLVMARFWYSSGCPDGVDGSAVGSFEDWHRKVGGIVRCARIHGFLDNYSAFIDAEDESPRQWEGFLSFLFDEYASTAEHSRYFTISELMERIALAQASPLRDALPAEIADCIERKGNHRIMVGKLFRSRRDRRFGYGASAFWLEREPDSKPDEKHHGAAMWRIRREV